MAEDKKKLGILLMKGPESQDVYTAIGLAEAALKHGLDVEIFMMYRAVVNSAVEPLAELCDKGAKVTVCSHNADQFKSAAHEKFNSGSQYDHSYLINESDRYLAFT